MKEWLIWFVSDCKYNWIIFIPMVIYGVWFEWNFRKMCIEAEKEKEK